jgi:hypothetical protein
MDRMFNKKGRDKSQEELYTLILLRLTEFGNINVAHVFLFIFVTARIGSANEPAKQSANKPPNRCLEAEMLQKSTKRGKRITVSVFLVYSMTYTPEGPPHNTVIVSKVPWTSPGSDYSM